MKLSPNKCKREKRGERDIESQSVASSTQRVLPVDFTWIAVRKVWGQVWLGHGLFRKVESGGVSPGVPSSPPL